MFPPNSYSVSSQSIDIEVNSYGVIFLTMQYQIKFPRYLPNKFKELEKWRSDKLLLLVLIENNEEKLKFP